MIGSRRSLMVVGGPTGAGDDGQTLEELYCLMEVILCRR